jgi:hypothetical protein
MDKTAIVQRYGFDGGSRDYTMAGDGWMKLVEIYSRRRLTLLSDKLMAIFGIAQFIRASIPGKIDSRYVAGIFTTALPRQLLWKISNATAPYPSTRPFPGRLPTWSWASVNSPIFYVLNIPNREEVHVEAKVY